MKTEIYAELKGSRNSQPVFEGLQVQAELRETLAITTITQSYRNAGSNNIETVYTFPLPLEAVLLEMTVTLGEKTLKGTVFPKQEAEERYEEAITDGDTPVMLQNPQPGVYTMNVGNLLPGERATIMFRYAQFSRWQADTLRYHLPTTIAPRYGSAERAGFEPQQTPETSLLAENLFYFALKVGGTLAGMVIESPTHDITIDHESGLSASTVRLVRKSAYMDRDLVITVKQNAGQPATATVARDGDEYLLWGSFQPRVALADDPAPRSVKIVVDCSGSMGGDSIAQAREALLRVLDELRPQDWFNIVAFGSTATPLFNAQTRADRESLAYARGFLKKLDATMGGTEIGSALEMAVRLRCQEQIQQDVLLITDGEVYEWEQVVAKAITSQHRFFTVGVGSAVSEAFVRTLAERSGGVCELVTPNEKMAERIHRHFKRIGTPRFRSSEVVWPGQPLRLFPEQMPTIYDGDTCNLFAWFATPPEGELHLRVALPDGTTQQDLCAQSRVTDADQDQDLPRMVAALKLREITTEATGQDLALKYQLVSRWTNYLAVVVRDGGDKAENLPDLHQVEQMLAAGWGGTGSVMPRTLHAAAPPPVGLSEPGSVMDKVDANWFHSQAAPIEFIEQWSWEDRCMCDVDEIIMFIKELEKCIDIILENPSIPELKPPGIIRLHLQSLVDEGIDERTAVVVFLKLFAGSTGKKALSNETKRLITKAYKELAVPREIRLKIEKKFKI